MGFLDFLGTNKKNDGDYPTFHAPELKAQAYASTANALPPIRGTLPVTGNGPSTLPDLKRAARKRSDAQIVAHRANVAAVPVAAAPQPESPSISAAPAPLVPRLRSRSKSVGRPSTAPSIPNQPLPLLRPKSAGRHATHVNGNGNPQGRRDSSRPPRFVVQKTTPGPPYLLGLSGPGADDDEDDGYGLGHGYDSAIDNVNEQPPPVPPIAAQYKGSIPSPSLPNKAPASSNGSVLTGKSGGPSGYVDILDAQGKFKPSDFKTRLQAAGARDYGEDVAERNLGVNGVNLESPAVLAFYALTGGGPLAYKSDGSAVDVHGNKYAPGKIPRNLDTHVQGKGKDELSDLANRRIRTPKFPTRTTSLLPGKPSANSPAAGDLALHGPQKSDHGNALTIAQRRKSVHAGPIDSSALPNLRPLSMHPVVSNFSVDNSATPPAIPRSRPTTADPAQVSSHTNIWRDSAQVLKSKKYANTQNKERPHSRGSRDVHLHGSVAPEPAQQYIRTEEDDQVQRRRSASTQSRQTRRSKRMSDDFSQFDFGTDSKGEIVMSRPSSRCSNQPGPNIEVVAEARPLSQRSRKASQLDQGKPEPSGEVRLSRAHRSASTDSNRNRSVGGSSVRGRTQLDDISEYIPKHRGTGRRNESLSSATQSSMYTLSSPLSSVASPHSRRTNDTSLDLGYSMPKVPHQSQPSADSVIYSGKTGHAHAVSSSSTAASSVRMHGRYHAPRAQAPSPFNYSRRYDSDDYASTTGGSDTDLPPETRRNRKQDGEDLLFKSEGYPGNNLPGLANDPEDNTSRPTWATFLPKQQPPRTRPPTSAPHLPEPITSSTRHGPPVAFPVWEEEDDSSSLTISESDNEFHHNSKRSTNASSANTGILSNLYDPAEEEMDERLDVKLAVRLRKEMKRRERTAVRRKTLDARAAYEQGHAADTES